MQNKHIQSLRFEKLHLHNYGIFKGSHDFIFDRQQTLIIGANGTGKTTIVDALVNLGPAAGIKPNFQTESADMSVHVSTSGYRELVNKYGDLIFLGCNAAERLINGNNASMLIKLLDDKYHDTIKDEVRRIFLALIEGKSWKLNAHRDPGTIDLAAGERVCLGYATVFAIRNALNIDLPVVLDSPYGVLDRELREGVSAFLKQQTCQLILLGTQGEFNGDDKADYILENTE